MTGMENFAIIENSDRNRFEAYLDSRLVGVIDYIPLQGKIIATHTEVLGDNSGRGIGSRLVRGMIDVLRKDGRLLQPLCPYVTDYLRGHPDLTDVVDPATPH